jgi:hypothetical protein
MNTDFFRFQYTEIIQKAEEGKTLNCKIENELKRGKIVKLFK